MNLSQDCFITDNLNQFIEKYLKDCKDEHAAEHIMASVKTLANEMDTFPGDEWHGITLEDGTQLDANFVTYDGDGDEIDDTEYIDLCPVKNGQTLSEENFEIYKRKVKAVYQVQPQEPQTPQKRRTYILQYTSKVSIIATSEDEAIAKLRDIRVKNEVPVSDNNLEIKCIGVEKTFEFNVKTTLTGKLKIRATDEQEAKRIVDTMARECKLEEYITGEEFVERAATFNGEITED